MKFIKVTERGHYCGVRWVNADRILWIGHNDEDGQVYIQFSEMYLTVAEDAEVLVRQLEE